MKDNAVETYVLERAKIAFVQHFTYEAAQSEVVRDYFADTFALRFSQYLYSEHLPPTSKEYTSTFPVDVPASTWQMFKRQHANSWWLRRLVQRFPVRFTEETRTAQLTVSYDRWRMFPEQTIRDPRLGEARLHLIDTSSWRFFPWEDE